MELYFFVILGVSVNKQLVPNQPVPMSYEQRELLSEKLGTRTYVYEQSTNTLIYQHNSTQGLAEMMSMHTGILKGKFVAKTKQTNSQ